MAAAVSKFPFLAALRATRSHAIKSTPAFDFEGNRDLQPLSAFFEKGSCSLSDICKSDRRAIQSSVLPQFMDEACNRRINVRWSEYSLPWEPYHSSNSATAEEYNFPVLGFSSDARNLFEAGTSIAASRFLFLGFEVLGSLLLLPSLEPSTISFCFRVLTERDGVEDPWTGCFCFS